MWESRCSSRIYYKVEKTQQILDESLNKFDPSELINKNFKRRKSAYSLMESRSQASISDNSHSLTLAAPTKKISKKSISKNRMLALKSSAGQAHCKYKFMFTLSPARMLDPFSMHRMDGDLLLNSPSESKLSNETRGLLHNFNCCKQPMTAIHDKNLHVVVFKVESHSSVITPIEMMVNRLDSLGDQQAHELAETLKYYGFSLDFLKNLDLSEELPAKNHTLYKDYQAKIRKIFEENREKSFVFSTRTRYSQSSKRLEVTEIAFSENFVKGIGVGVQKFIRKTLKKGFPDVVHVAGNYHEWYCQILQNTLKTNTDPRLCFFWDLDKSRAIQCQVSVEMITLTMENYIENTMVFICVPSKPAVENLEANQCPSFAEFREVELHDSTKKTMESEFLRRFYPEALKEL